MSLKHAARDSDNRLQSVCSAKEQQLNACETNVDHPTINGGNVDGDFCPNCCQFVGRIGGRLCQNAFQHLDAPLNTPNTNLENGFNNTQALHRRTPQYRNSNINILQPCPSDLGDAPTAFCDLGTCPVDFIELGKGQTAFSELGTCPSAGNHFGASRIDFNDDCSAFSGNAIVYGGDSSVVSSIVLSDFIIANDICDSKLCPKIVVSTSCKKQQRLSTIGDCLIFLSLVLISLYMYLLKMCLNIRKITQKRKEALSISKICRYLILTHLIAVANCFSNEFDKTKQFVDIEQSIAAVLVKVSYGSTTKRSIPDNAYPVTTLSTPLLTTYRYSDGSDEYFRVDVKNPENREIPRANYDYEQGVDENSRDFDTGYGSDLEKDHVLPTSAPAADILKNNNNKNYDNPNRYNNDRAKPQYTDQSIESATENVYKTTTSYNLLRNVRPTKSIYSKDVPIYVPPSRAFFTPPLPPELRNPFAETPTLRGTNSDGFANRRPIPPPSLMPNKDRIPFRPDLPNKVINMERVPEKMPSLDQNTNHHNPNNSNQQRQNSNSEETRAEKKKTLNTPSQNVNLDRLGEFYGLNRHNESNFEYEKGYIPSITRILSGSNGRHDDIPDILLRTVTATPNVNGRHDLKHTKTRAPVQEPVHVSPKIQSPEIKPEPEKKDAVAAKTDDTNFGGANGNYGTNVQQQSKDVYVDKPVERSESVTIKKETLERVDNNLNYDLTTQSSELNLPNVKTKRTNVTIAPSDEIWFIAWSVHVYLVVLCYIILAIYSIYKLIRYENDPHMFSKSYFLTIHLMLTVICVLRIFYLTYDPYNVERSFNIFLYDFLHNFPLSLLATTFAVLILFLLKRTLTHLKVKTRPVFLVMFGLLHILLCFILSIMETLGHFDRASLIVCKPVFVLLAWALGVSYLYLYKIIKNVLAKKSQNLSEMCTQNISYASHITIAVALLFVLLGFVQLYALFFIKIDRFNSEIKHHWILWSFELSVRVIEISIITLLAIVVSLKMSQREKQTVGFPLFPCTTSETSSDNIYPNNCNTNPNALNYSRQEMVLDALPATEGIERPNLLKNAFQNDSFDKKSTLERYAGPDAERVNNFDRFERPKWGSERFDPRNNVVDPNNFGQFERNFERNSNIERNSQTTSRNSARKTYDTAKYYTKPKYDDKVKYDLDKAKYELKDGKYDLKPEPKEDDYQKHELYLREQTNVYSEPVDQNPYERTRHEFERNDFDRRSRNSSNTSGRRSTTGRSRKSHPRPHLGVQTLPSHERHQVLPQGQTETMIVDDQGFVRFRHMQDMEYNDRSKRHKKHNNEMNHYSDA